MDEIRLLTRKFAQTELKPLIEADEESETFRPEIIKKLGALGLTGVQDERSLILRPPR